jgi:hypothetical protein
MTFARTLGGELVALDPAVIDAFANRIAGRVLVESAAEYEQARRVWNGLIDKRPAVIVRCSGVADVLDSLRFARDHNLLVAVRGGGHNVAGFGTCDGGLVIDLSPSEHHMNGAVRWRDRHRLNRATSLQSQRINPSPFHTGCGAPVARSRSPLPSQCGQSREEKRERPDQSLMIDFLR